jgi:hypothetical protein
VDPDSCDDSSRLCGGVVRPGWPTRSGSPIGVVAGQVVVVSGCPAGAAGIRADGCRDSGVARRAAGCSSPARIEPVDSCAWVDVADSGATDGLGEELGWRGYLLPRLLIRHRAVAASLILGLYWWLWHLPSVWTAGGALEGQPPWLLLADLLAKSLFFTYVFLGTQGSVLIAILLHASTNLFAECRGP